MKHLAKLLLLYGSIWLAGLCAAGCSDDDGPESPAPVLQVNEATKITRVTAVVTGRIDGDPSRIEQCGLMFSTAESDMRVSGDTDARINEITPAQGTVETTLTGLEAGATYYYCLYAVSGKTVVKSEVKKFTTAESSLPMLGEVNVVSVGENEIRVQSSIIDAGSASEELPLIGFEYKVNNETGYVAKYAKTFDEGSGNTFTLTIDGLMPGTVYHIRSTASNTAKGVGYSEAIEVKTQTMQAPVVATTELNSSQIGATWVEVYGEIENQGASEVVECGFCWSTVNGTPTIAGGDNSQATGKVSERFGITLTALKPNTGYYLRAYAANKVNGETKYGYGKTIEFTTDDFCRPVFASPLALTDVTTSSARISCTITDPGNGVISERGFCYSKSNPAPSLNDLIVVSEDETMTFSAQLTGIEGTYFIRAYVKYRITDEDEVCYSEALTFSTLSYQQPTFASLNATGITDHTAHLGCEFSPGNGEVIEKGFCWNTQGNPTPDDGASHHLAVSGNILETDIDGLAAKTTYYYRAYARYLSGGNEKVAYSEYRSFTTEAMTPPTFSTGYDYATAYTVTLTGTIGNLAGTTLVESGFCWSSSKRQPTLETNDGTAKATGNSTGFEYLLEGLSPATTYYYSAYLTVNANGENYTFYQYGEFSTTALRLADVYVEEIPGVTGNSIPVFGWTDSDGDSPVTKVGFCWSTDRYANPANITQRMEMDAPTVNRYGKREFRTAISGLEENTVYYVYAFATSAPGTAYSKVAIITTLGMPDQGDKNPPVTPN